MGSWCGGKKDVVDIDADANPHGPRAHIMLPVGENVSDFRMQHLLRFYLWVEEHWTPGVPNYENSDAQPPPLNRLLPRRETPGIDPGDISPDFFAIDSGNGDCFSCDLLFQQPSDAPILLLRLHFRQNDLRFVACENDSSGVLTFFDDDPETGECCFGPGLDHGIFQFGDSRERLVWSDLLAALEHFLRREPGDLGGIDSQDRIHLQVISFFFVEGARFGMLRGLFGVLEVSHLRGLDPPNPMFTKFGTSVRVLDFVHLIGSSEKENEMSIDLWNEYKKIFDEWKAKMDELLLGRMGHSLQDFLSSGPDLPSRPPPPPLLPPALLKTIPLILIGEDEDAWSVTGDCHIPRILQELFWQRPDFLFWLECRSCYRSTEENFPLDNLSPSVVEYHFVRSYYGWQQRFGGMLVSASTILDTLIRYAPNFRGGFFMSGGSEDQSEDV